jgi:hypothetical protein
MGDADLYLIRDGETLRTLKSGLEIVRREKHEWRPLLDKLPPEKLVKRTGKVWGSKFYADWTLPALTNWIESVVLEETWILQPGHAFETDRFLNRNIGLVAGVPTRKIKVVCDGRYVHAYPIVE